MDGKVKILFQKFQTTQSSSLSAIFIDVILAIQPLESSGGAFHSCDGFKPTN